MGVPEIWLSAKAWSEYLQRGHKTPDSLTITPDTRFSSLLEVAAYLEQRGVLSDPHTILVLDWDKTCRAQDLAKVWNLRFGEITQEEISLLLELHYQLCHILVVTNQIDSCHWIAQVLGSIKGYDAYPQVLRKHNVPYVGAPNKMPGITPPFKQTPEAVLKTVSAIDQLLPLAECHHIYIIGDRVSDMVFGQRIRDELQNYPEFHGLLHPILLIPEKVEMVRDNGFVSNQRLSPSPATG